MLHGLGYRAGSRGDNPKQILKPVTKAYPPPRTGFTLYEGYFSPHISLPALAIGSVPPSGWLCPEVDPQVINPQVKFPSGI